MPRAGGIPAYIVGHWLMAAKLRAELSDTAYCSTRYPSIRGGAVVGAAATLCEPEDRRVTVLRGADVEDRVDHRNERGMHTRLCISMPPVRRPHVRARAHMHNRTTREHEHTNECGVHTCNIVHAMANGPKDNTRGLTPHDAQKVGSPLPHLRRDWARPCHICAGTGLAPCHICIGTGERMGTQRAHACVMQRETASNKGATATTRGGHASADRVGARALKPEWT